jgi:hypothetical protein
MITVVTSVTRLECTSGTILLSSRNTGLINSDTVYITSTIAITINLISQRSLASSGLLATNNGLFGMDHMYSNAGTEPSKNKINSHLNTGPVIIKLIT